MTKEELKAALDELGVEYRANASEETLQGLLDAKVAGTEPTPEPEAVEEEEAEPEEEETEEEAPEDDGILRVKLNLKHNGTHYKVGTEWPHSESEPETTERLKASGVLA